MLTKQSRLKLVQRFHTLVNPRIDEAVLAAALARAKDRHPPPVLWLAGKTQAGKTSIIRALTGSPAAEIGSGFTACTRTTRLYDYPPETPVVRFLDTRGLGETGYDAGEDIGYCESMARMVIAVMRVTDLQQDDLYRLLLEVRRRHPAWPLIMVQTCLHEAHPGVPHVRPYPYERPGWELKVPDSLRRVLISQRTGFDKLPGTGPLSWTPVDLTQPEDQIEPAEYGLQALWRAIEIAAAMELETLMHGDSAMHDLCGRIAHPHITGYAVAAAGLGALPLADLALVPALHLKMLHTLAAMYRLDWTRRHAAEFFDLLGAGFLAGYGLRWAGRGLVKLVPGWGQTAGVVWSATTSAAITYAMGRAACYYLAHRQDGRRVDAAALHRVYDNALVYGRSLVSRLF